MASAPSVLAAPVGEGLIAWIWLVCRRRRACGGERIQVGLRRVSVCRTRVDGAVGSLDVMRELRGAVEDDDRGEAIVGDRFFGEVAVAKILEDVLADETIVGHLLVQVEGERWEIVAISYGKIDVGVALNRCTRETGD